MVSAEEFCFVRLVRADSEENNPVVMWDDVTRRTGSNSLAYPVGVNATALPNMKPSSGKVNENASLILEAKGEAADTLESEESGGEIPVVLISKKTGQIEQHRTLKVGDLNGDFSGFDSTNDVAIITGSFVKLGTYTVPSGFILMLDPSQKVHLYLGDDTA